MCVGIVSESYIDGGLWKHQVTTNRTNQLLTYREDCLDAATTRIALSPYSPPNLAMKTGKSNGTTFGVHVCAQRTTKYQGFNKNGMNEITR